MGLFGKNYRKEFEQLSKKYDELKVQNKQLNENNQKLQSKNDQLVNESQLALSIQQLKPIELTELIDTKENEVLKINDLINDKNTNLVKLKEQIKAKKDELKNIKRQIIDVNDQIMFESFGLYKPRYSFSNSSSFKAKLNQTRDAQKEMIRQGTAAEIFNAMTLNNSVTKGRSMQKKNIKQLLRTFNGECEAAINKVTKSNIEMIEKRITRSFEQLNKLNEPNGVRIKVEYYDLKIDEAHIALEYELKKESEREQLREQKEREREEKKLQQELARERKKYEKDESHFLKAQQEVQEKLDGTNDQSEIESLKNELSELQKQLDDLKEKKEKLTNRAENPTAGYVYIISNIGSFGKNVFKIGVTRRLEPMDRINELGSASVPFKFDVHALIFSEDAFKLESELHKHFAKQRINQVNSRKEYFNITIDEIKQVLEKYRNLTFDFHEVPEAVEFRESEKIRNQQLSKYQ